tara:strand:- start:22 stop:282 length:261 start_codon:yes stop_codon:yes gene_type:complete
MLIIFYTIIIFSITLDEVWNIYNPRINPIKQYSALEWEKDDFYSKKIYGQWILKKSRKSDNETKKYVRHVYWIQMVEKYPKLKKLP